MTAMYVRIHLPIKLRSKIPYELWIDCKPNLSHIKISWCKAFDYVNRHKRSKLNNKAVKAILIDYDNRSKSNRICTEDNIVMIVRTAKFIEYPNTNVKEEENLFDYQKDESNNFIDSDELVPKPKLDQIVDTCEEG